MVRVVRKPHRLSRIRLSLLSWAALPALLCFLPPAISDDETAVHTPLGEIAETFSPREQAEIRKAVEAILLPQ